LYTLWLYNSHTLIYFSVIKNLSLLNELSVSNFFFKLKHTNQLNFFFYKYARYWPLYISFIVTLDELYDIVNCQLNFT